MHKYIDVDLLQLVLLPWLNSNTDFGTRSEVCEQEVQVSLKSSTVELATKQNKNKSKPKGEEKSLMSLFPGLWSKVGVIYRMAKWHCKEETITNSIAIFSKPPNPKNAVHSPPQKKKATFLTTTVNSRVITWIMTSRIIPQLKEKTRSQSESCYHLADKKIKWLSCPGFCLSPKPPSPKPSLPLHLRAGIWFGSASPFP